MGFNSLPMSIHGNKPDVIDDLNIDNRKSTNTSGEETVC